MGYSIFSLHMMRWSMSVLHAVGQAESRPWTYQVNYCPNGGFHKWGYPQIIHSNGIFYYKQSFLGTSIYGTPQMTHSETVLYTSNMCRFNPHLMSHLCTSQCTRMHCQDVRLRTSWVCLKTGLLALQNPIVYHHLSSFIIIYHHLSSFTTIYKSIYHHI